MKFLLLFAGLLLLGTPALTTHQQLPQGFSYEVHGDTVYLTGPFSTLTPDEGYALLKDFISADNPIVCFKLFDTADVQSVNGLLLVKPWMDVCASKEQPDVPVARE